MSTPIGRAARREQQLLLPARAAFIWASLALALLATLLPTGRVAWVPDVLLVLVVFWSVHEPHRVGMGTAFALGLLVDVHQGALLGQHALCYTVLVYVAQRWQHRLLWLGTLSQMLQLLPLLVAAQGLSLVVRLAAGGTFPGWDILLAPVFEALLWPLARWVLLAPQRRAPDPDDNRPI